MKINNFSKLSTRVYDLPLLKNALEQVSNEEPTNPNQTAEQQPKSGMKFSIHASQLFPGIDELTNALALYLNPEELMTKYIQLQEENERLLEENKIIPYLEEEIESLKTHTTITNIHNYYGPYYCEPNYHPDTPSHYSDIDHTSQTTTDTLAFSPIETSSTPLTFDQQIQSESTPVQIFYQKTSAIGFFSLRAITCLTDKSKIMLLREITKPNNTPFAVAMVYFLRYYEHILLQFEKFSKEQFYRHISAALDAKHRYDTIKKNFLSITTISEDIKIKYSAWQYTTTVENFYNSLEKI